MSWIGRALSRKLTRYLATAPFTGIDTTNADSPPGLRLETSSGARPLVRNDPSLPNRKTVAVRLCVCGAPPGFWTRPLTVSPVAVCV